MCQRPITLKSGDIVPCGKCPQCKANQRQEWVFRLQREFEACEFGLFVTLTYDDEHQPLEGVNKRDVQLFLKRLRKNFPSQELRYYIVSEYGDHTHRPHYHGLFFFSNKHDKRAVYDIFESSWQNGFIQFGDIEEGSIVYCTKYCLKGSIVPEGKNDVFRLVSKMHGGIGANYIDKMQSFHAVGEPQVSFASANGKNCRMPRYYKQKYYDSFFGKNRSLNPLYMKYQWRKRFETSQRLDEDYIKQFSEFCKEHHYPTLFDAQVAFIEWRKGCQEREAELIQKHTKKQVF